MTKERETDESVESIKVNKNDIGYFQALASFRRSVNKTKRGRTRRDWSGRVKKPGRSGSGCVMDCATRLKSLSFSIFHCYLTVDCFAVFDSLSAWNMLLKHMISW